MKQEDEILLFKDICARLPYGVDCLIEHNGEHLDTIITVDVTTHVVFTEVGNCWLELDFIKPYLRPMSSMTKEEDKEWQMYKNNIACACDENLNERINELYDWFNKHYFDFRGLIEKNLAVEAPKDMYVTNQ